jgi:hypothetical protein
MKYNLNYEIIHVEPRVPDKNKERIQNNNRLSSLKSLCFISFFANLRFVMTKPEKSPLLHFIINPKSI